MIFLLALTLTLKYVLQFYCALAALKCFLITINVTLNLIASELHILHNNIYLHKSHILVHYSIHNPSQFAWQLIQTLHWKGNYLTNIQIAIIRKPSASANALAISTNLWVGIELGTVEVSLNSQGHFSFNFQYLIFLAVV